ncbi:MAG TPA: phenylalanine--tRNA ligase subunit beta [Acidimicrobiales bacterium]|nr:phenylalanine--tRNA ligase subunit beta [Acidimicrobiales bacterium]
MRIPLSWLRDFAPIEVPTDELTSVLNELGLIVDGVERIGEGLGDVVVARVTDIRPISGADRIRHVTVDAGGDPVEVVCGAWNFEVGDVVPLAPVGTVLPNGMEIARRKMRGAVSNGMLCSPAELHLAEDAGGLMLLPGDLAPGTPLPDALGLEADVVYELDITPNRPDAMSVAGVARDVAAALRVPFSIPELPLDEEGPAAATLATVQVEDHDLCPLFVARVMTDVKVGESPKWMAGRLALAGMRPINSVVDASNYVMLELGQPNHPYDLDRLPGGGLRVRAARPGEKVRTLDGVERSVGHGGGRDCLICDAEDTPVGLAGIMGGESSEIGPGTTRVLLEVAYFTPMAVARTSKRLGLRSEASARFERGCDPDVVELAAARVCALVAGSGARVVPGVVADGSPPPRARISLRTERVNKLLGVRLSPEAVTGYLEPIGFAVEAAGRPGASDAPGTLEVRVPGWRPDVTAEIDLVEEVARHHGYSKIERTVPTTSQVGALTAFQRERRLLRDVMVGAGLVEVWTPSLIGPGDHELAGLPGTDVELANPMSREESVLRRSMLPGLLRALRFNVGHRNRGLRFFEVGRVFAAPAVAGVPDERERLSVAVLDDGDATSAVRFWKTVAEALRLADPGLEASEWPGLHPTRTARARAGAVEVGTVGEVDPAVVSAFDLDGRVGWMELDLDALAEAPRRSTSVVPVTVYPTSDIDLAFVVPDSVPAAAVEATLRGAAGPLLESVRLFDVYRDPALVGEGRRSLAFRLRFGALDRTLTDPEVAEVRARCVAAVESTHGASLRG